MKWYLFIIVGLFLASYASAAPTLFDPYPQNNSYFGRGTINFSINVSSSTLDTSIVRLFVISEDAYINNEAWNNYTMQCSSYAADNWKCTSPLTFSIVASDTLEFFYFEATDTGGKASFGNENASLRFKIDRTPPLVTFLTPPKGSYVSGNVSVKISMSDAVSGVNTSSVQFSNDNSTWTTVVDNAASWNASTYPDNTTVFLYISAADNVGNINTTITNVTVENEKPNILITSPSSTTLKDTVIFSMNVSDTYSGINMSTARVQIGGSFTLTCSAGTCSSSINTKTISDGDYTAVFSVSDNASNTNTSSLAITIRNSQTAISLAPKSGYAKGTITVNATLGSDSTISNVSLKIQKGSNVTNVLMSCNSGFTLCSYTWATASFPDGSYTVTASAGNSLGNNITDSGTLIVDNTAPSITIDAASTVKTSFTARANVVDNNHNVNNVTFGFNTDKMPMTCVAQSTTLFCEIDYNPSELADGKYTASVTAVDRANNSNTASKIIALDAKPPEITFIKIEPLSSQSRTEVVFTVGVNDKGTDVSTVAITIKSSTSSNAITLARNDNIWSAKVPIDTFGGHSVDVYVEDLSQNSDKRQNIGYFYIGTSTCGDNVCQSYENYCLCPSDCTAPACDDEIECSSGLPACSSGSVCGDFICSVGETCNSCAADCSCNPPSNNNPFVGSGDVSNFIYDNPALIGVIAIALVVVGVAMMKIKHKLAKRKSNEKSFILDNKK